MVKSFHVLNRVYTKEGYFLKELPNTILTYLIGRGENDDNGQSYLAAELKFPKLTEYMNCHII